jgi:hypothetical protein
VSIQPHIRLTRSFDESTHSYLGYAIRLNGEVEGRHGMVYVEEDWVDEMAVSHRDPEE